MLCFTRRSQLVLTDLVFATRSTPLSLAASEKGSRRLALMVRFRCTCYEGLSSPSRNSMRDLMLVASHGWDGRILFGISCALTPTHLREALMYRSCERARDRAPSGMPKAGSRRSRESKAWPLSQHPCQRRHTQEEERRNPSSQQKISVWGRVDTDIRGEGSMLNTPPACVTVACRKRCLSLQAMTSAILDKLLDAKVLENYLFPQLDLRSLLVLGEACVSLHQLTQKAQPQTWAAAAARSLPSGHAVVATSAYSRQTALRYVRATKAMLRGQPCSRWACLVLRLCHVQSSRHLFTTGLTSLSSALVGFAGASCSFAHRIPGGSLLVESTLLPSLATA